MQRFGSLLVQRQDVQPVVVGAAPPSFKELAMNSTPAEPTTRIEEVVLRGAYATLNAKVVEHAHGFCRGRTLSLAHDELAGGKIIGIACVRCAAPQHCAAPVTGGRHGAAATQLTPAGWRCTADADAEGWSPGADGWSYI